jgi:hypothetical protein
MVNAKWMEAVSGGDPQQVKSAYDLQGVALPKAYHGPQRNMVSPMVVGAMTDASNQEWLNTI